MAWKKLGRIFCPEGDQPWMMSHASNPVADFVDAHRIRIFFSTRDANNRSSVAFVEVDMRDPFRILSIAAKPALSPGAPGLFDDSGASVSALISYQGKKYLYYLGWNLGLYVPWRNSIGIAEWNERDQSFRKLSLAPLLDRNDADPYSLSYPFVLEDEGTWRMWYGSNLAWGSQKEDMMHILKYAEGSDPFHWKREGRIAIGISHPSEYAFSRPCVLKENGTYRMWFSFRGHAYRMGYAESRDALNWHRDDSKAGILPSASGWDSETVEYPFIFHYEGKKYLLYNGNAFGKTGFGLAVWED